MWRDHRTVSSVVLPPKLAVFGLTWRRTSFAHTHAAALPQCRPDGGWAMQMATIKTQMQSKGNEANEETLSSLLSPASNALSLEEAQAKFGVLGVPGLATFSCCNACRICYFLAARSQLVPRTARRQDPMTAWMHWIWTRRIGATGMGRRSSALPLHPPVR